MLTGVSRDRVPQSFDGARADWQCASLAVAPLYWTGPESNRLGCCQTSVERQPRMLSLAGILVSRSVSPCTPTIRYAVPRLAHHYPRTQVTRRSFLETTLHDAPPFMLDDSLTEPSFGNALNRLGGKPTAAARRYWGESPSDVIGVIRVR